MIIDSSAIVAIAIQEPEYQILLEKLQASEVCGVGAPTLVETAIVLSARIKKDARGLLARFLSEAAIEIIYFGDAHYSTAVHAWLHYGKGRHSASLNFGDCLSYATARLADQPLLCTGHDFSKTDLELA